MLNQPCAQIASLLPCCLNDALTDVEASTVAQHLEQCAECRQRLERLAASDEDWAALRRCSSAEPASAVESPDDATENEGFRFDLSTTDFAVHYLTPATAADAIGQLDDIEILDVVGRGGMGIVLKGRQASLQRLVAVKLLRPDLAANGVARRRFTREAQATAGIVHPNVMPIHAIRTSGRLPYLVMPFLDCESLEQRIQRNGPLDLVDVLTIGLQVARALEAAHAQGLVHRDVKPENILLERTGPRAWLADFGLARAADDATLTRSGVIAGTPLYMSPEQARGESIDGRSDLFSLGSVLYFMCTGRPPFRAETTYGVLRRILESQPRPVRDLEPHLPDWIERLIQRLHEKSPKRRVPTAAETAQLLEQALRFVQQPGTHELPRQLTDSLPRSSRLASPPALTSSEFAWQLTKAFGLGGFIMLVLLACIASFGLQVAATWSAIDASSVPMVSEGITPAEPRTSQPPLAVVADATENNDEPRRVDSKYASAEEAYRVASGFLAQQEYAKSRAPLEEALKLAPDDVYRIKVYRALIPAYTMASDWKLKVNALDFIIRHSEQEAERSLSRREMLGFVRQRGKTKDFVKAYEERLKADPEDEATMYILVETYARLTEEPQKSAVLLERMAQIKGKAGAGLSVAEAAQLAAQYVKSRKYKEGAALFEATAERDPSLAAWHYKEAAAAWMKANDRARAIASAKASSESAPEKRSELLEYFWHRGVADVFLDAEEPALAIPHYEAALAKTTIEGYRKDTEQRLARARELAR